MKLIGLMIARNESWILGCSLRAALEWCDEVVFVDHASMDGTDGILREITKVNPWRIHYSRWDDDTKWDEMEIRQHSLELGRKHGGTHFAIIDADEVLTWDLHRQIREWMSALVEGQALEVPMLAMRTLDAYQNDNSVWSRTKLSLGFYDTPDLSWKPAADGYEHHHRLPYGIFGQPWPNGLVSGAGVMHLQFADKRRLLAKHVLYRMADFLRWPQRDTVEALNRKYDEALVEPKYLGILTAASWGRYHKHAITLGGMPWQEHEIRRLISVHGRDKFAGLDLKGL